MSWRVSRVPQTQRDYDADLVGAHLAVLSHPLRGEDRKEEGKEEGRKER